jgi:hypothetical protein
VGDALLATAPETGVDLCLRDADGRLTNARCVNARVGLDGKALAADAPSDGLQAAVALAVVRAIYHVTGSADVGRYYYEELVGRRDYLEAVGARAGRVLRGPATDFTQAATLSAALAVLGRLETDAGARAAVDRAIARQLWATGDDRDASHLRQAWYDVVVAAFGRGEHLDVRSRVRDSLDGFRDAPAFQRDRVNCDDAEIAAGACVAIDGVTRITLDPRRGPGGRVVAREPVPMRMRPDTPFEWLDDPCRVNGTTELRVSTGTDFLAAYWLARAADVDPGRNTSPFPRATFAYARPPSSAPPPARQPAQRFDAGGCVASGGAVTHGLEAAAALLAVAALLRRRVSAWRGAAGARASRRAPSSLRRP